MRSIQISRQILIKIQSGQNRTLKFKFKILVNTVKTGQYCQTGRSGQTGQYGQFKFPAKILIQIQTVQSV